MDFALRTFKAKEIHKGRIIIYAMMGLYTEAVKLALENNYIVLANDYAQRIAIISNEEEELLTKEERL